MTDLKPCPFCKGTSTTIEGKGQIWRGVKGYSDPQYFMLNHHGEIEGKDNFPRCTVSIRARTEQQAADLWNASTGARP